jgi:NDP-sugar pyrophosphorylase family protein
MNKNYEIDLQAIILVGGKGTRLGTLTKNNPKPLLNINNKP